MSGKVIDFLGYKKAKSEGKKRCDDLFEFLDKTVRKDLPPNYQAMLADRKIRAKECDDCRKPAGSCKTCDVYQDGLDLIGKAVYHQSKGVEITDNGPDIM